MQPSKRVGPTLRQGARWRVHCCHAHPGAGYDSDSWEGWECLGGGMASELHVSEWYGIEEDSAYDQDFPASVARGYPHSEAEHFFDRGKLLYLKLLLFELCCFFRGSCCFRFIALWIYELFCFIRTAVALACAGGEEVDQGLCQPDGGEESPSIYFGVGCHDQEQEGFDKCSSERSFDRTHEVTFWPMTDRTLSHEVTFWPMTDGDLNRWGVTKSYCRRCWWCWKFNLTLSRSVRSHCQIILV